MPGILAIFSKKKHIPENKNHLKDVKLKACCNTIQPLYNLLYNIIQPLYNLLYNIIQPLYNLLYNIIQPLYNLLYNIIQPSNAAKMAI